MSRHAYQDVVQCKRSRTDRRRLHSIGDCYRRTKDNSRAEKAALAGDATTARALDAEINALHRDLFVESNPIPVKWALEQMGLINSGIRLPLTPLSEAAQQVLRSTMVSYGLLK